MSTGRRAAYVVALVALAVAGLPGLAGAAPASFVFRGSGWGHRVGMSQFGALEQAADGRSWETILGHYYRGATVGTGGVPGSIRVFLAGAIPQASIEAATRFSFTSGGDEKAASTGGDGRWVVQVHPSRGFTIIKPNGQTATTAPASEPLKLNYEPWSTVVRVHESGERYRWGKIELQANGDKIRMVLDIPIERYLRGLAEVPASWPTEALRAQVVAARTYAADKARRSGHHRSGCDCTLYSDTRDQVYRGYEREDPAVSSTARWVAAVDDTAGKVMMHGGQPIQAYYHSSSGGRTEASKDVWSSDLPYLQSVEDPWSQRPSNPYAHWEARIGQEEVASKLGLRRVDSIDVKSRTPGEGVREATVRGNESKTFGGNDLRSKLGLRSTKFSIAESLEAIWTPWSRVDRNDRASGSPAMAVAPNGALHAVVTSPSGVPYASRRDPSSGAWSAWSRIGPSSSVGSDPTVTVAPDGTVHAMLRGRTSALYTATRDPNSERWSGWSRVGRSTAYGRNPSIAAGPDGVVWASIRGYGRPDAWVAHRGRDGAWSFWTKVGADAYEPTIIGTNGGALLVARGGNNKVKAATYRDGWSAFGDVAGGYGKAPALASDDTTTLLVVRARSSEHLYASVLTGSTWSSWTRVSPDQVATGAVPNAVIGPDGAYHVFVRGPNDVIYTASHAKGAWAGYFELGDGNDRAASGTAIAAAPAKGRIYALIRGPSAGLYWSSRAA